jgi:hypothetical protein
MMTGSHERVVILCAAALATVTCAAPAAKKPNFVVLFVDVCTLSSDLFSLVRGCRVNVSVLPASTVS